MKSHAADAVKLLHLPPEIHYPDSSRPPALNSSPFDSNKTFQGGSAFFLPEALSFPYTIPNFNPPPIATHTESLGDDHVPSSASVEQIQGVPKLRIPCENKGCPKTFSRLADMKRHFNKHDSRSESYFCDEEDCTFSRRKGKGFYRHDKLLSHKRNMHSAKMKESTG